MLLHQISFVRELQSNTINSFRRHFEHVALLSLLSVRLFRAMAVKQKQACTTAWLTSMNGEMILRQHFYSLGQNQIFGTDDGDIVQKLRHQFLDNNLIKMHRVNKTLKADLALLRQSAAPV
jgi:hypothetical protein